MIANDGWTAPIMVEPDGTMAPETTQSLVTQGATATRSAGAKTNIQYTLVFNDAEQQAAWYSFLRYLKAHPDFSTLPTTSAQVVAFLGKHVSQTD